MYGAVQMGKAPDLHREVRIVPPVGQAGRTSWSWLVSQEDEPVR